MRYGSLFSGIGGLDLGLERAGYDVAWQVEWDPFCTHILEAHWPHVQRYTDATTVNWAGVEWVDLLVGGFPCQPVSHAGRRRGAEDERWLWPAYRDAIDAIRPGYVLIENVPGLVTLGLDEVLRDLDALGYDAEWDIVSAEDVGAWHLRERLFLVAYTPGQRCQAEVVPGETPAESGQEGEGGGRGSALARGRGDVPDADGPGSQGLWAERQLPAPSGQEPTGGRGLDVFARARYWTRHVQHPWSSEPRVGRMAHGVPKRVDRLRTLGNAVVPEVGEAIGWMLAEAIARREGLLD